MANSKGTLILCPLTQSERVDEPAGKDREVKGDQRVAESSPSANGAEPLPHSAFNRAHSNGDESDARMAKIGEILDHAAMHLLDKCALVAEWVRIAEAKVSVFGQVVQKHQGGRPEGGVSRAARELPVPGKTFGARRKFIVRAVDINAISPEAKVAARAARLDDNQSALLEIASERLEAQVAKVNEIAARKKQPRARRKSKTSNGIENAASMAETPSPIPDVNVDAAAQEADRPTDVAHSARQIDQSKPASIAVLVEFAKFMLARISRGEKIVLTLTAVEDVKQFNTLANRAQKVIGGVSLRKN
jgi:hypothetical protein